MIYDLPTSVEIGGVPYEIRSDYRPILDICIALADTELNDQERAEVALTIFYPNFDEIPVDCYEEAIKKCYWFIGCGEDEDTEKKSPRLVDWEQDFKLIVSPVNRVLGREIRDIPYDYKTNIGGGNVATSAEIPLLQSKINAQIEYIRLLSSVDHSLLGIDMEEEEQKLEEMEKTLRELERESNGHGFHWWSFISAYYEIGGDCTFAQVVSIRDKLARKKTLDKSDREWYRKNKKLVDFKKKYTKAEDDLLKQWI